MLGLRALKPRQTARLFQKSLFPINSIKFIHSTAPKLDAVASKPVQKSPYSYHFLNSYHWNADRILSLSSPVAMGAAALSGHPLADTAMGIILPLHMHMGFGQMIEDYIPKRKFGILYDICGWVLKIATGLVLYGCYIVNSRDVGLTRMTKQLWTGKKE